MTSYFVEKIRFSYPGNDKEYGLPSFLIHSYHIIEDYFSNKDNNKLCLVFPSKDYIAQWISVSLSLDTIKKDFNTYESEIFNSYRKYIPGEKLILNRDAIVEWVGYDNTYIKFKAKANGLNSGAVKFTKHENVVKLDRAPQNRTALSSWDRINRAFQRSDFPIDSLLRIHSFGNRQFFKTSNSLICGMGKFNEFADENLLNSLSLNEYFKWEKITDEGIAGSISPLMVTNNLTNLLIYIDTVPNIELIVIDGFEIVNERRIDFSDIDHKRINTILITDYSELITFDNVQNSGFDFYLFNKIGKADLEYSPESPFFITQKKFANSLSFKFHKEIFRESILEVVYNELETIGNDKENDELKQLRSGLVKLSNKFARLVNILSDKELEVYSGNIKFIEDKYFANRFWLGNSGDIVVKIISLLRSFLDLYSEKATPKLDYLLWIVKNKNIDYIVCPYEDEAMSLRLAGIGDPKECLKIPKIVSISDITDRLITGANLTAILTGWPRINKMNSILYNYIFSELIVLFYPFENKYCESLELRNSRLISSIDISTLNHNTSPIIPNTQDVDRNKLSDIVMESSFDIYEYELRLDKTLYSTYAEVENVDDIRKGKRIDFENDTFLYAAEQHKFIVINELLFHNKQQSNIFRRKVDSIQVGDVIALINTDRDVLVELVKKITNPLEYSSIEKWITLWKELLYNYYRQTGFDFQKLVRDIKLFGCKRHEGTIRTWLQDETKIGPEDDADLLCIAKMAHSDELKNNISATRFAIKQMTGWRMKASDIVRDKIRSRLIEFTDSPIINSAFEIPDLGTITILKVQEIKKMFEDINKKYINRLLIKEIL